LAGREVQKGKVLYLAGENQDDARMRRIKLAEEMGFDPNTDQMFWLEGVRKLDNDNIWRSLMDDCRTAGPFALVITDTAAAYFPGDNENDNEQQIAYWQRLRRFTEIPGGPTVLVPCHPSKYATPENLVPRGGSGVLREIDGYLTVVKRERIAEVHFLKKWRGVEFAPFSFELRPGTTDKLLDSRGRKLWTVTARPMDAGERATADAVNASNEDRVLRLLLDRPGLSYADMAVALGWRYASTNEPDKSKVTRTLDALAKDGLAKKDGGRGDRGVWTLTKRGKAKAPGLSPETWEVPM
jgi:hypothetical protein